MNDLRSRQTRMQTRTHTHTHTHQHTQGHMHTLTNVHTHTHTHNHTHTQTYTHTHEHTLIFMCCAQNSGSAPSAEDEEPVVQWAKRDRVSIVNAVGGKIMATICVVDAQPKLPRGWGDPKTQLGDYVLVDYQSAKPTVQAQHCVAEKINWRHYLRKDWTVYTKDQDEDDDPDGGGWEILLQFILDEGENFLIYREFLQGISKAPKKKKNPKKADTSPPVSTQATSVAHPQRARDRNDRTNTSAPPRKPPVKRNTPQKRKRPVRNSS